MKISKNSPIPELAAALKKEISGEVRDDPVTRLLYSTDASIYQVEPLGVVFPRTPDELAAAVEISRSFGVPILARGAGSSLAGQAVGAALILDCSRYLKKILAIDPEARTATVEPGVILNALNRAAGWHGLQFGPDPASAERATVGGSLANNASGSHSILYGMAADHLLSAEVVLSDGSLAAFEDLSLEEAWRRSAGQGIEASLYRAALHIRKQTAEAIRQRWPRTWRRASGYNLNYLIPWTPASPPSWGSGNFETDLPYPPVAEGRLNLAPLLAGSEGGLAVIRRATLRLVPVPVATALGVLPFSSIPAACDAVPALLEHNPSAVELIPQTLIQLARSVPAYASQLAWVDELGIKGGPPAVLVVEFSGDDPQQVRAQVKALGPGVLLAAGPAEQRQVWAVRKVGLGLLMSRAGDVKPWSFIEDLSVPVERLGEFVREMEAIMAAHGTHANFYAHASAGCLHIRPLLSLKTVEGVTALRAIATQAVSLTIRLGGAVSGEHGDGLARSEWLERLYGPEITSAFRELKRAADPDWLLNPGKIVSRSEAERLPPMDANLRFGVQYQAEAWQPSLDFSRQAGLLGAVEQCNGAGVCRKAEGVMCPSFQATQEEMHSTRGRANLLRSMLSGAFPSQNLAERSVYEALDLCLACKGCQAECPSAVDMARLKYEFLQRYYRDPWRGGHLRKPRDFLFAYISWLAQIGRPFAPLANALLGSGLLRLLGERLLGLSAERQLPRLQRRSLQQQVARRREAYGQSGWRSLFASKAPRALNPAPPRETALFLSDAFTEFFYPEVGLAAVRAMERAGCRVEILPVIGAGRTLISKGFLEAARQHARQVVAAIDRLDPQGQACVVGVEPSEILTLRDEYLDLLPGDRRVKALAERAYMLDEFLIRPGPGGRARRLRIAEQGQKEGHGAVPAGAAEQEEQANGSAAAKRGKVLLHGHCYQKATSPAADGFPTGVAATVAMLEAAGYEVQTIEAGCCGMAGAFGYEREHYDLSLQIGELGVLPAARAASPETILAASGVSCQAQIEDGARRHPVHPALLI